jgi:hypothetical protein
VGWNSVITNEYTTIAAPASYIERGQHARSVQFTSCSTFGPDPE